jgi:hypothetical protein
MAGGDEVTYDWKRDLVELEQHLAPEYQRAQEAIDVGYAAEHLATYTTDEGTGGFMPDKRMTNERLAELSQMKDPEYQRNQQWAGFSKETWKFTWGSYEELLDALIAERNAANNLQANLDATVQLAQKQIIAERAAVHLESEGRTLALDECDNLRAEVNALRDLKSEGTWWMTASVHCADKLKLRAEVKRLEALLSEKV